VRDVRFVPAGSRRGLGRRLAVRQVGSSAGWRRDKREGGDQKNEEAPIGSHPELSLQ
jgi:hypothetical protein